MLEIIEVEKKMDVGKWQWEEAFWNITFEDYQIKDTHTKKTTTKKKKKTLLLLQHFQAYFSRAYFTG